MARPVGPTAIFVYGTLMPGEPLWPTLAPYAVSWERVTARGHIWDTGCGYPAVHFDTIDGRMATGVVPGVLVALDPGGAREVIAVLDRVEEVGRLYRRVEVSTSAGPAFAYEWLGPVDGLRRLSDGWPLTP